MMTPLDTVAVRENMPKIKNRSLLEAYRIAAENRDLDFFRRALAVRNGGHLSEQTANPIMGLDTLRKKLTLAALESSNKAELIRERPVNKRHALGRQHPLKHLEGPSWPLGRVNDNADFPDMDESRVRDYWTTHRGKEQQVEYVPSIILTGDDCKYCEQNTHRGSARICEAFHYGRRWASLKNQVEKLDRSYQFHGLEGRRRLGTKSSLEIRSSLEPEPLKRSVGRPRKYDR
jgi:hypothetical protein